MDTYSAEKYTDHENKKRMKTPLHFLQRPHHQQGSPKQRQESHWAPLRSAVHSQKSEAKVVWECLTSIWACQDSATRHSSGREEERQTKEMMGRYYHKMDWFET
ncbi:hypothetical protein DPMN_088539 [Dreissena polymorpha]|uniref:Uncharacterized protein n=1 Tax=Dreissena polymorpha TaxID=45954 RepID=A0A9D4QXZ3_DREPO|nr:hypothetical protein DPMN_088539 [Dreissena polymorpha]